MRYGSYIQIYTSSILLMIERPYMACDCELLLSAQQLAAATGLEAGGVYCPPDLRATCTGGECLNISLSGIFAQENDQGDMIPTTTRTEVFMARLLDTAEMNGWLPQQR
jgi:hypothetical protein